MTAGIVPLILFPQMYKYTAFTIDDTVLGIVPTNKLLYIPKTLQYTVQSETSF